MRPAPDKSYVLSRGAAFRQDEAVGAQALPLTPGRSIRGSTGAACLRHAEFSSKADCRRVRAVVEDAVPPA